jgi:catechol 2,3-dioxygenase-like lactoylglutathione lyase family enzyme
MPARRAAIHHITIGVSDLARSRAFYERALAPLHLDETNTSDVLPNEVEFGRGGEMSFAISTDYQVGAPVHIAFAAETVAEVHAFYAAALAAGGINNGAPGLRPEYSPDYFGAFVLDPDGHNVEAVTRV